MNHSPLILSEIQDSGIALISLNRSDKGNALSRALIQEFTKVLLKMHAEVKRGRVKVLILRSTTPKAFCLGADLTERLVMKEKEVLETLNKQNKIMKLLESFSIPTICVLEGGAFGGGLELALAADLRIASPTVQLALTETRLAIIPGSGGTQRLMRLVGLSRAKELIFLARRVNGLEAENLGLVNRMSEKPMEVALEWASEILLAGPLATKAAKKALVGASHLNLSAGLKWERECYKMVLKTEDRIEGLKAFSEKRKAQYKGR